MIDTIGDDGALKTDKAITTSIHIETPLKRAFAKEMAKHGKREKAAIAAGVALHHAQDAAAHLAIQPIVQDMIEEERQKLASKLDISDRRILAEIAAVGFGNICDVFDDQGRMRNVKQLNKATQRAIKSVRVKISQAGDEIVSIEMHPKLPALQQLVAIKGMDKESNKGVRIKVDLKKKV